MQLIKLNFAVTICRGADDSKDETAENSEQKQSANVSELSQPQARYVKHVCVCVKFYDSLSLYQGVNIKSRVDFFLL